MSIIKCPNCRGQVSTMAGTCPHCSISIAGQLRQCPNCGGYCLLSQETCPECSTPLPTLSDSSSEEKVAAQNPKPSTPPRKKRGKGRTIVKVTLLLLLLAGLCGGGYYYYDMLQCQKEQADYERLEGKTNPEFYQQFLIDYPDSKHYDEINERMHVLQTEVEDWKKLLQSVNRTNISLFLQKHPGSLRERVCEEMLDSIDWQDAIAIGNEEAITDYLHRHPSGRYVDDAAERKNSLLLSKVTPEEKAMIRGTLEAFFSKAIGDQDIEAAKSAIPDTMISFCGKQKADAETIVNYAQDKMAKDVIGLHYAIGQQMIVRKETLPDGNTGFAVEVNVEETISRSDTNQPTSNLYRINASLNQEQKIVRMNIFKE